MAYINKSLSPSARPATATLKIVSLDGYPAHTQFASKLIVAPLEIFDLPPQYEKIVDAYGGVIYHFDQYRNTIASSSKTATETSEYFTFYVWATYSGDRIITHSSFERLVEYVMEDYRSDSSVDESR